MVKKIEAMGIKTLSYYIDDVYPHMSREFKQMYGAGSRCIDVTNVSQITKTINQLFMNKK